MDSPAPPEIRTTEAAAPPRAAPVAWAVLAWSAVALALGLGWAAGLLPPGVPADDGFGSLYRAWGTGAAAWITLALGAAGAVCAVVMMRPGRGGRATACAAWGLSAAVVVLFVTGSLLAFLGYSMIMPVVGWFVPGLPGMWVEQVLDPENLGLFFFAAGAGLWAVAGLSALRAARGACPDCGRDHGWTPGAEHATRVRALRVGRIAVAVACLSSLAYPALRFPWLLGLTPGMGDDFAGVLRAEPGTLLLGVGLGSAAVAGTVLTTGLVLRWGVRFPFWAVGLAGRRVPVALAVVPATAVAVALVAMGRSIIVQLALGQQGMTSSSDLHTWVFLGMAVWGAALAVAVAAYAVRRRGACSVCGRGLPEAEPHDLRAAA
ncbi:hypothetical protein SAMN05421803_101196 [Nocardiopsis flavescens]|uniref:Uncharacterized protein n=1 Tax=Nocardiopsis flavescens TaxID=758803 RepID=A0A1M6B2I7_9ACTN|nr:hypothetical protein [Nocardiopsis flavescens]SHI42954.1 hypothetical protein SAMN05421803_101196 [Nocardiopsis flavescens]